MKNFILPVILLLSAMASLNASVVVTNGLTHRHQLATASVKKGLVVLKNIGKKPERVMIYLNDMNVNCATEELDVADPGSVSRSNARWIKIGVQERLLAPGEEFPLSYEINTPQKEVSGTYWSLLMVEVKKPIDTASLQYGVRVSSNVRYAVQIITDFETTQPTEIKFQNVEFGARSEGTKEKALMVELKNECEKLVVPQVKIEVYNETGELLFERKADAKKLYPKQCRDFVIPVTDLPGGKYQAVLVADCGASDLFGMTINLEVDE